MTDSSTSTSTDASPSPLLHVNALLKYKKKSACIQIRPQTIERCGRSGNSQSLRKVSTSPLSIRLRLRDNQKEDIVSPKGMPVHFSICWFKSGCGISKAEQREIARQFFSELERFFETRPAGHTLTFTTIKKRPSCAYGKFDDDFEQLVIKLRKRWPEVSAAKDLPFEQHPELDEEALSPIMHHVQHSKSENANFNAHIGDEGRATTVSFELVEENK